MFRKQLLLLAFVLLLLVVLAAPVLAADCGLGPAEFRDWAGCTMDGASYPGANLFGANLSGASFIGADLSGADLRFADLSGAVFTNADLTGAKMQSADLTGTDFTGADLTGNDMRDTMVSGAIFDGATIVNANMSGAINFDNVSFVGASIHFVNLDGTTINEADFTGTNGVPLLGAADMNDSTCSDGTDQFNFSPFCFWQAPTMLELVAVSVASLSLVWPWVLVSLLSVGTLIVLGIRYRRQTDAMTV